MYFDDEIVYSGIPERPIRVVSVRALDNFRLLLKFNTGEIKEFDFSGMLKYQAFEILNDKKLFENVHVEYGCVAWGDGDIDIAPELLYSDAKTIEGYSA